MDSNLSRIQTTQQQQQQQTSRSSPLVVNLGGPNATSSTGGGLLGTETSDSISGGSGGLGSGSIKRNGNKNNNGHQRSHSITNAAATSFVNLLDGFTSRVSTAVSVTGSISSAAMDRSHSAASTPSSTHSGIVVGGMGVIGAGSIASLTSMGSLGTTANAFYSSIGSALNSITSPITAAAAAATATTTEVVVAAASAITNHLSSPTSGTPPHGLGLNDEDCDDNDEEDDDDDAVDNDGHIAAPTPSKTWAENKFFVQEIRKKLSNLSTMVPTDVQFRYLSDGRARCYFLSTPPQTWETTLLFTDINLLQHDKQQLVLQQIGGTGVGSDIEDSSAGSPNSGPGSPTINNMPAFLYGSMFGPRYICVNIFLYIFI